MSQLKKRVFITGAIKGRSAFQLNEFEIAKDKLMALGVNPTSCIDAMGGMDVYHNNATLDNYKRSMRKRAHVMMECDMIVALPGWEDDSDAKREWETAVSYFMPNAQVHAFIAELTNKAVSAEEPATANK